MGSDAAAVDTTAGGGDAGIAPGTAAATLPPCCSCSGSDVARAAGSVESASAAHSAGASAAGCGAGVSAAATRPTEAGLQASEGSEAGVDAEEGGAAEAPAAAMGGSAADAAESRRAVSATPPLLPLQLELARVPT